MIAEPLDSAGRLVAVGQIVTIVEHAGAQQRFNLDRKRGMYVGRRFKVAKLWWSTSYGVDDWFCLVGINDRADWSGYREWPVCAVLAEFGGLKELVRRYAQGG